ncbi:hypothetical protein C0J52_16149 [Blattella germanica]|nr:hypothetical protein C0J52_16149 [Blattella germanica]
MHALNMESKNPQSEVTESEIQQMQKGDSSSEGQLATSVEETNEALDSRQRHHYPAMTPMIKRTGPTQGRRQKCSGTTSDIC